MKNRCLEIIVVSVLGVFAVPARATLTTPTIHGTKTTAAVAQARAGKRSTSSKAVPQPPQSSTGDASDEGEGGAGSSGPTNDDKKLPLDTQLMVEALKASRGESPNAPRIERVTAQVKSEAKRRRIAERQAQQAAQSARVWKDPFAEDPEKAIPVPPPPIRTASGGGRRDLARALARARAETAVAQAVAASAQADAAKAKADTAKAEATAARVEASAARREAEAARLACVGPSDDKRRPMQARKSEAKVRTENFVAAGGPPRERSSRARRASKANAANASRVALQAKVEQPAQPPEVQEPPPESVEASPPPELEHRAAFTSPSGILVVPITR